MAHEECAKVVPETWVDEVETEMTMEKRVFGVDAIVRDRWNLVCSNTAKHLHTRLADRRVQKCAACTKARQKAHGAPIQCTKGKCAKSFHVGCARNGGTSGIVFSILREVEKEVILVYPNPPPPAHPVPALDGALDPALSQSQMQSDAILPSPAEVEPQVLKSIKKYDVHVLCLQHNPVSNFFS